MRRFEFIRINEFYCSNEFEPANKRVQELNGDDTIDFRSSTEWPIAPAISRNLKPPV